MKNDSKKVKTYTWFFKDKRQATLGDIVWEILRISGLCGLMVIAWFMFVGFLKVFLSSLSQ